MKKVICIDPKARLTFNKEYEVISQRDSKVSSESFYSIMGDSGKMEEFWTSRFKDAPVEPEKPSKFAIAGKPHQLGAIKKDLEEIGYTFTSSSDGNLNNAITISNDSTSDILRIFRILHVSENKYTEINTFNLPVDYQAALDFAKAQLEHEFWKPKEPETITLTIGSQNDTVTIGKGFIRDSSDVTYDAESLISWYCYFVTVNNSTGIGRYNIQLRASFTERIILIGCPDENHLFSPKEIQDVISAYDKLNP